MATRLVVNQMIYLLNQPDTIKETMDAIYSLSFWEVNEIQKETRDIRFGATLCIALALVFKDKPSFEQSQKDRLLPCPWEL